jgi:hypothetical protein
LLWFFPIVLPLKGTLTLETSAIDAAKTRLIAMRFSSDRFAKYLLRHLSGITAESCMIPIGRTIVMFGMVNVEPWIGPDYDKSDLKLLVLGESRYDEDYTDQTIIQTKIDGQRKQTFTDFVQAALGKHHSDPEFDAAAFWNKTIFYNYLFFFPGGPRIPVAEKMRANKENWRTLERMLETFKPTHCIVWGVGNWRSIEPNLRKRSPLYFTEVKGHKTLFVYVKHPSTGFSFDKWTLCLRTFFGSHFK